MKIKILSVFLAFSCLISSAWAAPFRVAIAGDSISYCYQYRFSESDYWDGSADYPTFWNGSEYTGPFVYGGTSSPSSPWAISGQNTSQFDGKQLIDDVHNMHGGAAGYFHQDNEIAALNPDFLLFMLGTNDSHSEAMPVTNFENFKANIDEAFSKWGGIKHVIIASILPKIGPGTKNSDWRITNWYNPYLQLKASEYGYDYFDLNGILRAKPDMADYYYIDGVHLNSSPGYPWLADSFSAEMNRLTSVPEPSSITVLATLFLLVLSCLAFRKK